MASLKNLVGNIPDWIRRLDELDGQIDKRQKELARWNERHQADSPVDPARSVRNKGSSESLRPRDDPPAFEPAAEGAPPLPPSPSAALPTSAGLGQPDPASHPELAAPPAPAPGTAQSPARLSTPEEARATLVGTARPPPQRQPPPSPIDHASARAALDRQTNSVMAVAQAKALATVRKRQRSDSVVSAEGTATKYRSRSMLIVYYDSYVQSFFEELVKFVSASRNMMRKAKMAARVARIKRMADLEVDDDGDKDAGDGLDADLEPGTLEADTALPLDAARGEPLPPARFNGGARRIPSLSRTAMMVTAAGRPMYTRVAALGSAADQKPDAYDELDACLEFVQSTCEHAAHQFLRDGECSDEIAKVQQKLRQTKDMADREMDRLAREDPDALKADEPLNPRSFRVQSMRNDDLPSSASKNTPAPSSPTVLEVDEGIDDMDEEPANLVFNSTRGLRTR